MTSKSQNLIPLRVAVGISGGGRTLQNLLVHQHPRKNYQIVGVFASSTECMGLRFAQEAGLPIFIGKFPAFSSPKSPLPSEMTTNFYTWLMDCKAELVALAGFLRPFPLTESWRHRVVNIHPALLPKFGGQGMYGMRVHQAVINQKATHSGATVHYVTEIYDEGEIISQIKIPVAPDDTAEILASRVFKAECQLYPDVLDQLSQKSR